MKIEMGKKYTSNGESIHILCTDRPHAIEYKVIGMRDDGAILYFTEDGKSPAWPIYNLVEVWEPQKDEWCLFWDDENKHYVVLYRFIGMSDCGRFKSDNCISWKYCAKFDGTLPEHMREKM
jgi:hypothetical protein